MLLWSKTLTYNIALCCHWQLQQTVIGPALVYRMVLSCKQAAFFVQAAENVGNKIIFAQGTSLGLNRPVCDLKIK